MEGRGRVFRDETGEAVHLIGIVIDITERKRAEQRVGAQHAVTRVLAEAATLAEATPEILQAVCQSMAWDVGAIWDVDPNRNLLRCVQLWHPPAVAIPEFG